MLRETRQGTFPNSDGLKMEIHGNPQYLAVLMGKSPDN
jgi:hypothetical protein